MESEGVRERQGRSGERDSEREVRLEVRIVASRETWLVARWETWLVERRDLDSMGDVETWIVWETGRPV